MATTAQISAAARAVRSAFESGIPFLQFGDGETALKLASRRKGDVISDPACDMDFEALQHGVFKRCLKLSGEKRSFTYLWLAPNSQFHLEDAFETVLSELDHVGIESLPMDAAWQAMQWKERPVRGKVTDEEIVELKGP